MARSRTAALICAAVAFLFAAGCSSESGPPAIPASDLLAIQASNLPAISAWGPTASPLPDPYTSTPTGPAVRTTQSPPPIRTPSAPAITPTIVPGNPLRQPVQTEIDKQVVNNCGGTGDVTYTVAREREISHQLDVGSQLSVKADGSVKVFGIGVELGMTVAASVGATYGKRDTVQRTIQISVKPKTKVEYEVSLQDVYEVGEAEITVGSETTTVPYRFFDDFELVLLGTRELPCSDTPTAEPTSIVVPTSTVAPPTPTAAPPTPTAAPPTPTATLLPTLLPRPTLAPSSAAVLPCAPDHAAAPCIQFTYIPPLKTPDHIKVQGRVQFTDPTAPLKAYKVLVYIKVGDKWYAKPSSGDKWIRIAEDGTWSTTVIEGGADRSFSQIKAYLVPYEPVLRLPVSAIFPSDFDAITQIAIDSVAYSRPESDGSIR